MLGLTSTIPADRGRETEARAGHALFQRPHDEWQQSHPTWGTSLFQEGTPVAAVPSPHPGREGASGEETGQPWHLATTHAAVPMRFAVVAKPCALLTLSDNGRPGDNEGYTESSDEGPGQTHRSHQREELRQMLTTPRDTGRPGDAAMALGHPLVGLKGKGEFQRGGHLATLGRVKATRKKAPKTWATRPEACEATSPFPCAVSTQKTGKGWPVSLRCPRAAAEEVWGQLF